MPEPGLAVAVAIGVVLILWYLGGNELMRRRAARLAVWTKRVVDPLGGKQSIRWLGSQAFRLEVEDAKAPFRSLQAVGLVESWDTPIIWALNRLRGRRDLVQLQVVLRQQPLWGLELYRRGTILTGDARHFARQEGWPEEQLDEFSVACAGETPRRLAADLLKVLSADRARLVRLAVRRQATHVTLALNVPDPGVFEPMDATRLAQRLAETVLNAR